MRDSRQNGYCSQRTDNVVVDPPTSTAELQHILPGRFAQIHQSVQRLGVESQAVQAPHTWSLVRVIGAMRRPQA